MPSYRIGFGSDFNLNNSNVGIGTTLGRKKLDVIGVSKGDFNITGVSTLTVYGGFVSQKQNVSLASTIGFSTSGVGTFVQVTESETGYLSLVGEYNTVSEDIIVDEGKIFEVSVGSTVSPGTLESVSIQSHFSVPNGGSNDRPDQPTEGMVRFNDDLNTLEFYNGIEWRQFTVSGASGRGVFPPGLTPAVSQVIDYITISSLGNAINFGDLTHERRNCAACSSSIRGLIAGGFQTPDNSDTNEIMYITLASEGDAIDFGTLGNAKRGFGAAASSTRGLFADATGSSGEIEYVEIATLGNALDFGELSSDRGEQGALSSPTRMVIGGGGNPSGSAPSNVMDFVTISSLGNAIDFGDLVDRHGQLGAGFGNSTRGIFAGGLRDPVSLNVIQFITIASTGNAIVFGHLAEARSEQAGAASNSTRGVVAGGNPTTNTIEYITISTASDALDFGDLAVPKQRLGGGQMSDSHGGLGGF